MNGLASSVECIAEEKKKLIAIVAESAKVIIDLLAQLKESESKMKEFELEAAKEKEVNKELEKELLAFKKEAMEQHENGFYKAIRQVEFFTNGLDLGLFDLFKEMKDDELHDEEDIAAREQDADEEEDDGANVQAMLSLFFLYFFGFVVVLDL